MVNVDGRLSTSTTALFLGRPQAALFITPNENLISIQRTLEKIIKKIILQLYSQQQITRSSTSTTVPWPTLTTAPKNVKVRVIGSGSECRNKSAENLEAVVSKYFSTVPNNESTPKTKAPNRLAMKDR